MKFSFLNDVHCESNKGSVAFIYFVARSNFQTVSISCLLRTVWEKIYKNVLLFMENHLMLQWAVCIHLHLHNWSRRWRSHLIWAGVEDGGAMCRLSFCVHTLILLIGYISFLCPHTWFSTPPRFLLLFLFYFPYLPIP